MGTVDHQPGLLTADKQLDSDVVIPSHRSVINNLSAWLHQAGNSYVWPAHELACGD